MSEAEVLRLLDLLDARGVRVWLDGGWGVDALLQAQTREHDDLDLVVELDQVPSLTDALERGGYEQVTGSAPMSFVLVDHHGH